MVKKVFKKKISFKGEENPFNLKLNREKHTVLGQNTKGTKGLRCISRANIHLKRKELYNKSKKASQKANKFVDRRLLHEDEEDSITARFVQERKKKLKKNKYNLNDEELTHGGIPLHALKNLKDEPVGSDDEEQLDAAFVNKAHFGGANQEPLSHKEIIDKLILDSKQKKHEKKIERELTLDLTEKLDQDWKASISGNNRVPKALEQLQVAKKKESILDLLQATDKPKIMHLPVKTKPDQPKEDPYNILEMDLKYSKKSTPITRTKTVEELEKEEQEKQFKLEQERSQRMNDDRETKINAKDHLSADSIIDDFDLEPMLVEDNVNEKSSSDKDSDYSDSEVDDDSDQSDHLSEDDHDVVINDDELEVTENDLVNGNSNESFDIPTNIDEFEEYLENHNISAEDILAAVEQIIKPFLKAKSEKRLNKLSNFFGILIEYSMKYLKNNYAVSENLAPHLFDIAEVASVKTSEKILSFLDEEQDVFQKCKAKKKKNNFPRLQSLLLLKYCSVLYSVSDFIHPVVTPAILFMCDILSSEFFITFQNIESRLYICSIVLDCVIQSKRLVPEALSFLNKMLKLACPHKTKFTAKNQIIDLVIDEKQTSSLINDINVFCPDESVTEDLRKLSIILKSVNLLNKFSALYVHLPSFNNLFSETLSACSELPIEYFPPSLTDAVSLLVQEIKKQDSRNLLPLTYENTKPKPLKLFEPAYESKFTKKDDIKRKLKVLKNVSQKIKKVEKDMLREMRRDLQVVAAEKLKEQLESDAERKRKVKELYHDLAVQEGKGPKTRTKGRLPCYNADAPFERMALDILGFLPVMTRGNRYVLVLMDYFTKWPEAVPIPDQEDFTVTEELIRSWLSKT
ncbi:Nucleolar protein 14 [Araneus ventricosus]|uniref:Nucleolar protein 14 n=1 Tax=Araneus ventricosus TaxID=182803 RepID=A0A4Y2IFS3_ARAVE|nr:Nucleolar protein 14 [Araneus ventricosus]